MLFDKFSSDNLPAISLFVLSVSEILSLSNRKSTLRISTVFKNIGDGSCKQKHL